MFLASLEHYLKQRENKTIKTEVLLRLAEIVLTKNCFLFNGKYYAQCGGTMMGTPFGVEYANLFMSYEEEKIEREYTDEKPSLHKRFIDDIFGAAAMDKEKLDKYLQFVRMHHPALQYTVDISSSVNMLDTTLLISNNTIESTLYCKPTDTHSYLNYNSSHPHSCKNSIPYSQFLRIRRICSTDDEFRKNAAMISECFRGQGYPKSIINRSLELARRKSRHSLLNPIVGERNKLDRIVFPITFHKKNLQVCRIVKGNYEILSTDTMVKCAFNSKPMIAFRRGKNLHNMLVRSTLQTEVAGGTTPCDRSRCLTCNHITNTTRIIGPRGYFDVKERFTCISEGVVYAIECKKCGSLYIGETGRRLADRFREHRNNVLKDRKDNEVAGHFNQDGHCVGDMQVYDVRHIRDVNSRKLAEQKIISQLGCFLGSGMNVDFNYMECM